MTIFIKPVRMCVVCRVRFPQKELFRLQCLQGQLSSFSGIGRSFYICKNCQIENSKKMQKILNKECKKGGEFAPQLKEIIENVGQN